MHIPQRIHIVGAAGSGKTTLAHRLGACGDAPIYELDTIGYAHGVGARRPLSVKLAEVHAIAQQPRWISEGIFLWWTDQLFTQADVIIWLDLPWHVTAWRIGRRHLLASWRGTNKHPGLRRLLQFLHMQRAYHTGQRRPPQALDDDGATTRFATAQAIQQHTAKLIHCRQPSDIAALLALWEQQITNTRPS